VTAHHPHRVSATTPISATNRQHHGHSPARTLARARPGPRRLAAMMHHEDPGP
jgi:hypothetical protein